MCASSRLPRVLTITGTKGLCRLPTSDPYNYSSAVHFSKCENSPTFGTVLPAATKVFVSDCENKFVSRWVTPWTFPSAQEIYLDSPITEMLKQKSFHYFLLPRFTGEKTLAKFYITGRQLGRVIHPFPRELYVCQIEDYQFRKALADVQ